LCAQTKKLISGVALLPARRSRHPTLLQDKSSLTDWEHYDSIFTAKRPVAQRLRIANWRQRRSAALIDRSCQRGDKFKIVHRVRLGYRFWRGSHARFVLALDARNG
jgi:hypothetical protein